MSYSRSFAFFCNGFPKEEVDIPPRVDEDDAYTINVHEEKIGRLTLPEFIGSSSPFSDRILDILEVSTYVFIADQLAYRGSTKNLEFHSWSRDLTFYMAVRDFDFWSQGDVRQKLSKSLRFLLGDETITFEFSESKNLKRHDLQETIFTGDLYPFEESDNKTVTLFSGGLDSTAGVIDLLNETDKKVVLVSHQSSPVIKHYQNRLVKTFEKEFPERAKHLIFRCHMVTDPRDYSQRSRGFLYQTLAFAVSEFFGLNSHKVFENGVTSINIPRHSDAINARTSRTTHPRVIDELSTLFSQIRGSEYMIEQPFIDKTKTDTVSLLKEHNFGPLLSSTYSCSRSMQIGTFQHHCGKCFQCVDRRLAVLAADVSGSDAPYEFDLLEEEFPDPKSRTTAIDYLRQARKFTHLGQEEFANEFLETLSDIIPFIFPDLDQISRVEELFKLFKRHGKQVRRSIVNADIIGGIFKTPKNNSLASILSKKPFLKDRPLRMATQIANRLKTHLPQLFQSREPDREVEINDAIQAFLNDQEGSIKREFPSLTFATGKTIPDHELEDYDLIVESKYPRDTVSIASIRDGIIADMQQYPLDSFTLFIVYDPTRTIVNDTQFKEDLESVRDNCMVTIIR